MACICVGGGGGCTPNGTVQDYLSGFGYTYNQNDPLASVYQQIIAQYDPTSNIAESNAWKALAEACMRARAVLYCKSSPGDCGGIAQGPNLSTLADAGKFSQIGIQTGSEIASALGVASTTLGAVTAGAGAAVSIIIGAFEQHAQAEAAQANALCQLCPQATAAIQSIDGQVLTGSATSEQGVSAISQLATSFAGSDASLTKSCNAFCGYNAIMKCLAAVSSFYYSAVLSGEAPAVGPTVATVASPSTSLNSASATGYALPSSFSNFFSSLPVWAWVAIGVLLLIVLFETFGTGQQTVVISRAVPVAEPS